jgi:hypothetical protein
MRSTSWLSSESEQMEGFSCQDENCFAQASILIRHSDYHVENYDAHFKEVVHKLASCYIKGPSSMYVLFPL